MWIKLARNRFWIAFCVIATVGVLLRDNWSTISAHVPQQSLPNAIARMFSPAPTYAASDLTLFSYGSRAGQTNKGRSPKPSTVIKKPSNALAVQSDATTKTPARTHSLPETGEGEDGALPDVETSEAGNFTEERHLVESAGGAKMPISHAAAWLSEAQIVAEYDVASHKWLASGIKGNVLVESDADNGSPEDTYLVLTLPADTRMALYEKYALVVVDKKNVVRPAGWDSFWMMDDSVDSSEPMKLEARFDNVRFDNIKTVRLVASPLNGSSFRETMSAADKRLVARGIYLVPKELREPLRRMNAGADDAGIASGTVIVEATSFPTFASTHAVPDAVIVTTGQPVADARDENSATFTLFLPRYMANHNIHVTVYDSEGNSNSESYSSDPIKERETEFAICKTYTFNEFRQSEIKRVVISVW